MKKIIICIVAIILVVIGFLIYTNVKGNISPKSSLLRICYMSEGIDGSVKEEKNLYEESKEDSTIQKIRKNNIFPSNDISDYVHVGLFIELKNNSLLDISDITGYLLLDDPDSIIIYKYGSIENEKLSGGELRNTYIMGLLIYKGNMTDQEILEYIQDQDIEIYYRNKYMSHLSKIIHMSDLSIELDINDLTKQ